MSRRSIYPNRHDATSDDLDNTGLAAGISIRERSRDIVGTGVVTGLNISINVDGTYNISIGTAYDANGERIRVAAQIVSQNLASLVPGVTNFIAIAYKALLQRDIAHPFTGVLSPTREEESVNPKAVLTFDTTPGVGESDPPLNLDENGNPLVLIATIVPDTAGGFTIDESVRTFVLTTTENLSNLQQQIDANKNAINTVRGEVIGGRQDFDVPQTLWSSLTAHFFHLWERILGHFNDQTNPHDVTVDQTAAQGGGVGSLDPSFLHPQSLNPSTPLPRVHNTGVRLITIDASEIAIAGSRRINTSSLVVNIDAVGINGRDVIASITPNATYFLFGMTLAGIVAGNTFEAIATLNSGGPSPVPPGYTPARQRLLTTFQTDGSANIIDFDVVVDNFIPAGFIGMWSGTIAEIPAGWLLCDGTSGTPNLTDKFIQGAKVSAPPGGTGGSTNHTHTATATSNLDRDVTAVPLGAGFPSVSHTHPVNSQSNIPPFFRLAFIMKA